MSFYIFPHQLLLGSFRGISHCSVPPHGLVSNLGEMRSLFICSMLQMQPLPVRAHFLQMQIPQVAMALRIYCLRITDTRREKGGHLRMEDFYFCLSFFARTVAGLLKGRCPRSQSRLCLCIWTWLWKRAMRLVSRVILALPYFTKHTVNPLTSSFFICLTRGAQRTTWTQVALFSSSPLFKAQCFGEVMLTFRSVSYPSPRSCYELLKKPYLALP